MPKLHFVFSAMNAGKSTMLLQTAHNYHERGMGVHLLVPNACDKRIQSRIGIGKDAEVFSPETDLFKVIGVKHAREPSACVLVDESQFASEEQVWQLARVVDDLSVPVMCYGLRTDFRGELFAGSKVLLAIADELREVRTICHCGKRATMVIRKGEGGRAENSGDQILIGGNEVYESVCRKHWRLARSL